MDLNFILAFLNINSGFAGCLKRAENKYGADRFAGCFFRARIGCGKFSADPSDELLVRFWLVFSVADWISPFGCTLRIAWNLGAACGGRLLRANHLGATSWARAGGRVCSALHCAWMRAYVFDRAFVCLAGCGPSLRRS